jgi:hypothetical protein
MTDHPILFSAPMVRANLDGRKTMTRMALTSARVFATPERPAFTLRGDDLARALQNADRFRNSDGDCWYWEPDAFEWQKPHTRTGWFAHIGYAPGDRLWVREGFALVGTTDPGFLLYRASGYEAECARHGFDKPYPSETIVRWRPSIYMPRWASRITLAVEAVRVERLHDISERDARAEGCFFTDYGRKCFHQGGAPRDPDGCSAPNEHHPQRDGWMWDATTSADECLGSARSAFGNLWNHTHGPDAWDANPWVSVTTFGRIT